MSHTDMHALHREHKKTDKLYRQTDRQTDRYHYALLRVDVYAIGLYVSLFLRTWLIVCGIYNSHNYIQSEGEDNYRQSLATIAQSTHCKHGR